MNRAVSVGKVILCCLMVFSVVVEAGKRRLSFCERLAIYLSFSFLGSEAQRLSSICMVGERHRELPEAALDCNQGKVFQLLKNGHNPDTEAEYCFFQKSDGRYEYKPLYAELPKTTPRHLALSRGILAKEEGNLGLLNSCVETVSILDDAIKRRFSLL